MSDFRPLPFVRFLTDVLRIVTLTIAQRVLYTVACDFVDPVKLSAPERAIAAQLFGPSVETIPVSARSVLAQRKGARVGGSRFAALRLLHLGLTLAMNPAPGEVMTGIIVAPDLRLARQTLRYIVGAVHETPELAQLVIAETTDSITLKRPDGIVIEFVCLPATQRGSAVRGRSLFGGVLSEASFMRDDNFVANDRDVFRPVIARIIEGGQLILESTPFSETDLLYELMQQNFDHPITAIAAHCPTLLMRDDRHTIELVEREFERDAVNAQTEFGAVPRAQGTSKFFPDVPTDDSLPETLAPVHGCSATFGLDAAFRADASGGTVCRINGSGVVEVAATFEIRPPAGGKLVPSETLAELIRHAKRYHCQSIVADQHYIEVVREARSGLALVEAPAGAVGKASVHVTVRRAMADGKIRIPALQKRLVNQLKEITSKPVSGGGIAISTPRRAGAHGDVASSFLLAAYHLLNASGRYTGVPVITTLRDSRFYRPSGPFDYIKPHGWR